MILLILDIDGTLTDSVSAHHSCFLRSFEQFEIPEIDTDWGSYQHHTDSWILSEVYRRAFDRLPSLSERKAFEDTLTELFEQSIQRVPIVEIPGASEFLRAVQNSPDIAYGFATGSFREPAESKLATLRIDFPSELLVTASEFETRDEIVERAVRNASDHFGVREFRRAFSMGDGYWDFRTAQNLNLEFVGIALGEKAVKLQQAGADRVFPDLATSGITKGWSGRSEELLLHV